MKRHLSRRIFGVPGTGKQITVKGMIVDRVVAGKMAHSHILIDTLGMMTQLGVIPGGGSGLSAENRGEAK